MRLNRIMASLLLLLALSAVAFSVTGCDDPVSPNPAPGDPPKAPYVVF